MQNPRILVAPLDWGLGHVTRCIPIVNELISRGVRCGLEPKDKHSNCCRKKYPVSGFYPLPDIVFFIIMQSKILLLPY